MFVQHSTSRRRQEQLQETAGSLQTQLDKVPCKVLCSRHTEASLDQEALKRLTVAIP